MDGASSTLGESFVQFWPKFLPLWCKSVVAGASPPFGASSSSSLVQEWCSHRTAEQLWWKQGKFGASSVRLGAPRALLGSKTHTGETCSATLSLSLPPALCPETSSHRPPPLSPLPSTSSPSPSQNCPPKIFSYEIAFPTFSLIERAFGCNSSFLHFFL